MKQQVRAIAASGTGATHEPSPTSGLGPTGGYPTIAAERVRCDACGRFLGFAELAFSQHHFVPLNEFGPEESAFTGPCCRYRSGTSQ
jgi:hypothetical protein